MEIYTVNKTVRDNEVNIYNSYYPTNRPFKCVDTYTDNGTTHFKIVPNCATEVYLNIDDGQKWNAGGKNITFTVAKVVQDAGTGTIGSYDLAIVGRGDKREALNRLNPGDKVTLRYGWSDKSGKLIEFNNLVGGNAQVMNAGTLTKYNTSENYNRCRRPLSLHLRNRQEHRPQLRHLGRMLHHRNVRHRSALRMYIYDQLRCRR